MSNSTSSAEDALTVERLTDMLEALRNGTATSEQQIEAVSLINFYYTLAKKWEPK